MEADRSVSIPRTLSDLERRGVNGQNFLADLHNYARMIRPRMTKFGTVTQVGEKHVYWGQPRPKPNGVLASPKLLGTLEHRIYMRPNNFT